MLTYLVLGILGVAVGLIGTTAKVYWLIPVGLAMIIGAFFWFVRARQGTPIMTKENGTSR